MILSLVVVQERFVSISVSVSYSGKKKLKFSQHESHCLEATGVKKVFCSTLVHAGRGSRFFPSSLCAA